MLIIGISDSHNSSACLYEDGQLLAAISEERLRRVKNWTGFPQQAVRECLRIANRRLEDVDYFALAGIGGGFPYRDRDHIIAAFRDTETGISHWRGQAIQAVIRNSYRGPLRSFYRSTSFWKTRDKERWRQRVAGVLQLGVPEEKISLVGHHMAHASAAYYGCGKFDEDVLVLTNDGSGDRICASVNVGRNGKIETLAEVHDAESIGFIYGMVTCLLGMVPLEHEYKLMGMAPYAEAKGTEKVYQDLKRLFDFDGPDGIVWSRRNSCPETYNSYHYLRNLFELRRFDGICGGLQRFTEEFVSEWVRNCIRATGIRKIALSGGLFMNVKLNKVILELPEVEELFVFPSCGDETNAIGAAYHTYATHESYRTMQPVRDLYLGPEYDDEQIKQTIEAYPFKNQVSTKHINSIEEVVAEMLAEGQIVARFNGREEFGARALGNRSIMADPSKPEVIKVINDAIKSRDFWMPFAPSLLDRCESDYCINPKNFRAPYMIMAFDSTNLVNEYRAACHPYDLTLRPQVVYQDWNPSYYKVISAFERMTGRGIVLNTSFNLHGYPIVSFPKDALNVFDESGLDQLAIGSYLLRKESRSPSRG